MTAAPKSAEVRESALATALCLLDTFAGEGLGHTYGNGQVIDADTTVSELCAAFGIDLVPGWYRTLATALAAQTTPAEGMPMIWEDPAGKGYPCFERPMTPAECREMTDRLSAQVDELKDDYARAIADGPAPLLDGDLVGILRRAAEQEDIAARLHRTAIVDGLTDDASAADWSEKKAHAFRAAIRLLQKERGR